MSGRKSVQVFNLLFILSIAVGDTVSKKVEGEISLTSLTSPHVCAETRPVMV
jgi:hypothetical protein